MEGTERDAGNLRENNPISENGFLKVSQPCTSTSGSETLASANLGSTTAQKFEGKEALSYANTLRSRNKFADALVLYENVLEKDPGDVEAHIGKGICLQMQRMGRLAFDSFAEAIKLDPQNACALTHCGILYKDEGRLVDAAEVNTSLIQKFMACFSVTFSFSFFRTVVSEGLDSRSVIQAGRGVPSHCVDRSRNEHQARRKHTREHSEIF